MATLAARLCVGSLQFKIGESMIEGLRVELDDIGFAAFVIGVAVLALGEANVFALAVQPTLFR